ncbi:MAG: hypothetical protein LBJ89_03665 [Holosporales bacterium]|jgi:hypothetical protein|nr:hypothetical protein [Holosporales bacterium]
MKCTNLFKSLLTVIFTFCLSENMLGASSEGVSPAANPVSDEEESADGCVLDLTNNVTPNDIQKFKDEIEKIKNNLLNPSHEVYLVIGDTGSGFSSGNRFASPKWVFFDPACSADQGKVRIKGTLADLKRIFDNNPKLFPVGLFDYIVDDIGCIANDQAYSVFTKMDVGLNETSIVLHKIMKDGALLATKKLAFLNTTVEERLNLLNLFYLKQGVQSMHFSKPGMDHAGDYGKSEENSVPLHSWTHPCACVLNDMPLSELNLWISSRQQTDCMAQIIVSLKESLKATLIHLCETASPVYLSALNLIQADSSLVGSDIDEFCLQLGQFCALLGDIEDVLNGDICNPESYVSTLNERIPTFQELNSSYSRLRAFSQDQNLINKLQGVLSNLPSNIGGDSVFNIIYAFENYRETETKYFSTNDNYFLPRTLKYESVFLQKKAIFAD